MRNSSKKFKADQQLGESEDIYAKGKRFAHFLMKGFRNNRNIMDLVFNTMEADEGLQVGKDRSV